MITTVTLNAAIDQVYEMNSFVMGQTNRVMQKFQQGGGKGINVARVIKALDGDVLIGGFIGGLNGEKIKASLQEQRLPTSFIQIEGESRICLTVTDYQTKEMTELLEEGPTIQPHEWKKMLRWVEVQAESSEYLVLSGSLPKGLPPNAYATIIHLLKQKGVRVTLDTSGEALKQGIEAIPFAIKPNEDEISQLIGKPVEKQEDLIQAGEKLRDLGIEHVCFSLGEKGALFINSTGIYQVNAPKINVVNTVGSGDAFLAGLIYKLSQGASDEEAYRWAVACGSVNAGEKEIAKVQKESVESLLKELQITNVKVR
ncbi:1-phosphofructokinase [Solibacillus sp. MA9]|uniref:Tagatose-6-phosphate kinase n=1 Tax=Solibacillus palustris TaxID=2908203 RepID=A0ABS9UF00_9BACL|nr:1-phosphofructokinase [Solibacillus sp. MA9]MCH7322931.1 1-phosphofructokinase [Solibacillus sp. MA9]